MRTDEKFKLINISKKQAQLLEELNIRQIETDLEEILYDLCGDELDKKDEEIKKAKLEIEKLKLENKILKQEIRKNEVDV